MGLFGHGASPMWFGRAWAAAATRSISLFASGLTEGMSWSAICWSDPSKPDQHHVELTTGFARLRGKVERLGSPERARQRLCEMAAELGLSMPETDDPEVLEVFSGKVREAWKEANRATIEAHSRWVDKHGLPLAKYRMF